MQVAATRQDLLGALDNSRRGLLERLASKREIQTMQRDIQSLIEATRHHEIENKLISEVHSQFQRQQASEAQLIQRTGQLIDKLSQLDSRLNKIEQDMHVFREILERTYSMY